MATLDINGQRVTVDDSFLKLSPEDQQSTVDHIAANLAPKADPVSINNLGRSFATGVPIVGGLLNKADAATNAALAPALNRFFDEKDQLPEATFGERYAHSLRDQEGTDAKFAAQHPVIDTGAKLAGGVASMAPVVSVAPGLFGATGTFAARTGMGATSNALLGGTDAAVRGEDPVKGALVGGVLGGAMPAAEAAVSPFISSIMARINPRASGERQVARAISESGRPAADIAGDVTTAAAEGQPQFTLADAIGNPGQRMLSSVARAPGEGRTDVVNALEQRQAGQGRRVANAVSEGFGSRMTPEALRDAMTAERGAIADEAYGAVRNDAGRVDVVPTLNNLDRTIGTGPGQTLNAPNDSVESILRPFRERIARVNPDDFEAVQRIRSDMADTAQNARQSGYGNRARLIGAAVRDLDAALENASSGYRQANRDFAGATRNIEAIDAGRTAALRGRTEDTIPEFNALSPRGQQAFRTGYADPLISQAQGAAVGANKARPLINDAFTDEAAAMAPGNDLMQRRIAREQTMFTTRNQALGGSRTADNLADHEALGINPTTVMHVASGHWSAAIGSMLHAGVRGLTGNTPAVRKAIADILLQNGATISGPALNAMVTRTIGQLQFLQTLARSGVGAAAVTTNANQPKPPTPIFVRQP
ncbi:hypothetical protein H8B02_11725 [Bradyrhizobium sp. Pear77]|uniref:hypothetical protein n=1 Tax=Bradyrhizobium altum TaxID=1571202 RepID=UPI001E34D00B|nr:hypothetical protein [Bradyrhizobium altum]MCC8954105.1 hypothetical protein [Bradyrhizobium altum]